MFELGDQRWEDGVVFGSVGGRFHHDDVFEGSYVNGRAVGLIDDGDSGGNVAVPDPGVVGSFGVDEDVDGSGVGVPAGVVLHEVVGADAAGEAGLAGVERGQRLGDAFEVGDRGAHERVDVFARGRGGGVDGGRGSADEGVFDTALVEGAGELVEVVAARFRRGRSPSGSPPA